MQPETVKACVIRKALIIDEPWIGHILAGRKVWEMRATDTSIRGDIALVRKGSGQVVAVANLVGTAGPLDRSGMLASVEKHRIPAPMIENGQVDRWCYAWKLDNVHRLPRPVRYEHPNGAVIWVNLGDATSEEIRMRLGGMRPSVLHETERAAIKMVGSAVGRGTAAERELVPFARDNTCFNRLLGARGYFQVGAKGEEVKYDIYGEAFEALKKMKTARWRRPNSKGNWGIVTAVRWARAVQ